MIEKNPFVTEKYQDNNLFLIYNNKVHILTGIAPFIWENIGVGSTKENLLSAILVNFEVKPKKANKDLEKIIKKFERIGVIINN
jgi:hypothetical protein